MRQLKDSQLLATKTEVQIKQGCLELYGEQVKLRRRKLTMVMISAAYSKGILKHPFHLVLLWGTTEEERPSWREADILGGNSA